jgi:hypothetical protein
MGADALRLTDEQSATIAHVRQEYGSSMRENSAGHSESDSVGLEEQSIRKSEEQE